MLFISSILPFFQFRANAISNYVIDGNVVYVNDENCYIAIYPHTIYQSQYVYLNVTSKKYSGQIDFCFGFDSSITKPKNIELYLPKDYNETQSKDLSEYFVSSLYLVNYTYEYVEPPRAYNGTVWIYENITLFDEANFTIGWEWQEIYTHHFDMANWVSKKIFWLVVRTQSWKNVRSHFQFDVIDYNFMGMNKWFLANASITKDVSYHLRFWLKIVPKLGKHYSKYFIAFKPQNESLTKSIEKGHFYFLDPWWDSSWSYRKSYTISNATGAGTNYQVLIKAHYGSGTDSGNEVYLNNHCQADFDDIRFLDNDNSTELDFWVENVSASLYADIWIEVVGNLNDTAQTIHLYYGNGAASSTASGANTFLLFDHFPGSSINTTLWSTSGSPGVANSRVTVTGTANEEIYSKILYGAGTAVRAYGYLYSSAGSGESCFGYNNDIQDADVAEFFSYLLNDANPLHGYTKTAGSPTSVTMDELQGSQYRYWNVMWKDSSKISFQINGGPIKNSTSNIPTTTLAINIYSRYTLDQEVFDWVLVRKYVDPEPADGTWSAEESMVISYTEIGHTTNIAGALCYFYCMITSGTSLGYAILSHNNTGSWTNETEQALSGMNDIANVSVTLSSTVGIVIGFKFYANNSGGGDLTTTLVSFMIKAGGGASPYIVSRFKYNPARPYVGESISFNGSYSESSDTITNYSWTFGDGDSNSSAEVSHSYSSSGLYDVNLTITSAAGSDLFSIEINVTDYYDPFSRFVFSSERPYVGETITFNASTAESREGNIITYEWTYGDGNSDSGVTVTHSYSSSGLYRVWCNITDSNSKEDKWSCIVNVTDYIGPIARFTFAPSKPRFDDTITFNATTSSDSDGTISTYSWSFGDGNTTTGQTATHSYGTNGEFTVTLNVTDDHSKWDTFSQTFNVTANSGPTAFFTYKTFFPMPKVRVSFYADESVDSDGTISSYFWDFDDGENSTGERTYHSFDNDGSYNVTLTVTDDDGDTDNYSRVIEVLWGAPRGVEEIKTVEKERITLLGEAYITYYVSIDGFFANYMNVEVTLYLENLQSTSLNVTVCYAVKDFNITVFEDNSTFNVPAKVRQQQNLTFKFSLGSDLFADIDDSPNYSLYLYVKYVNEDGKIIQSESVVKSLKVGNAHFFVRWVVGWVVIGVVLLCVCVIVWNLYRELKTKKRIKANGS